MVGEIIAVVIFASGAFVAWTLVAKAYAEKLPNSEEAKIWNKLNKIGSRPKTGRRR